MKITLYTSNGCSNCNIVKQLLKAKHVEFDEVNLSTDTDKLESFRQAGARTLPVLSVPLDPVLDDAVSAISTYLQTKRRMVLALLPGLSQDARYLNLQAV